MSNCRLIVDSCCDLPPEIVKHTGVTLVKFPYSEGNATYEDDLFESVSAQDFYNSMRKGAQPSTSQLSMNMLTELFEKFAKEGTPTVYLSFSGGLSASCDVSMLVRDKVKEKYPDFELYVVDTCVASIAEGLLVYEAIQQLDNGLSAKELAEWAEEARFFIDCEFMVEDLEALHRGGRIPSSAAAVGGALDVKPMLNIDLEGKLKLIGVARGRKKGIRQLVDYYQKHKQEGLSNNYVLVGHADCPKDANRLSEELQKTDSNLMVIRCNIGPVIGSHVGPGMLALAFWSPDRRESLSISDKIAKRVHKGED